ncbi:hypothetical protein BC937DRAFT_94986, partial [Endogone sp. FLAS-F59071]
LVGLSIKAEAAAKKAEAARLLVSPVPNIICATYDQISHRIYVSHHCSSGRGRKGACEIQTTYPPRQRRRGKFYPGPIRSHHPHILTYRPLTSTQKKALKRSEAIEAISAVKREVPEFSASNIDDALDLLTIATSDDAAPLAGRGQKEIERHPERRFKAALAAYEERYGVGGNKGTVSDWMVNTWTSRHHQTFLFHLFLCYKHHTHRHSSSPQAYGGINLRISSSKISSVSLGTIYFSIHHFKRLQKSEENPFNQANVLQYNAEQGDEVELIDKRRNEIENRLKST